MKKSKIIKSTIIIMVITLLSRFIGLFRDILISHHFGATEYTDAYKLATAVPETIFMIVGLAISTTFLPMLSKVLIKDGKAEMNKFANNIINLLLVISILIFVVSSLFPADIANILTDDSKIIVVLIPLIKITLINILFLSINACFTAILQVNEDFIIPSILGLFFNLPIILYLLIFKDFNIYGLTIANVIGNFLRVVVQIPSLSKNGYRYRFFIDLKDKRIKAVVVLIVPVVIGAGANSLNMLINKSIASRIDTSMTTVLDNSQLLITMINTMITTSITTVIYPVLVNTINEGKHKEFLNILSKTIIYLGILLIPITSGIIIYGEDVVRLLFFRGQYTETDVIFTGLALVGYSFGLFFTGARDILNSTLFSMGKTKITAKNGVIGVVINIILSVILSKSLGIQGIAIASSIAMMITAILLFISIIRIQGAIDIKEIIVKNLKILVATIVMTIIILIINALTKDFNYIITLVFGVTIGGIVYLLIISKMRIKEVAELISFIKNKI